MNFLLLVCRTLQSFGFETRRGWSTSTQVGKKRFKHPEDMVIVWSPKKMLKFISSEQAGQNAQERMYKE